jgi:hypothetical protein
VCVIWDWVILPPGWKVDNSSVVKLAVISCGNGLGHIKRVLRIVNCLADHISDLEATLFCEPWQMGSLKRWSEYCRFHKRLDAEVVPVSIPIRWSPNEGYYDDWLWKWHTIISTWELSSFDCVLSDNLVEPLLYADRVILSGSFLWHDVLATAFPDNQAVLRYQRWAEDLLKANRPNMIINRYFAMPVTERQTNAFKVGFISFCETARGKRNKWIPKRVLVALGNTEATDELKEQVVSAIPFLDQIGVSMLCSPAWHQILLGYCGNVELYDFDHHQLDTVDLAIVRAGIGTISDCVAAKVPMLYVRDHNPEVEFNQERLSQLGIGMSLKDSLRGRSSPLTNASVYQEMFSCFNGLALGGDIEAANFLITRW